MPSITLKPLKVAFTAATTLGIVTVASSANIYPGTNAWIRLTDASVQYRVRVLDIIDGTHIRCRRWPTKPLQNAYEPAHDQENYGPPRYGWSDLSAVNAGGVISFEAQTAVVDPAFSKKNVP
jgi:hypothetical protein